TTELLQRLIRFNTVNPPGNEQAAQEFLKELLEAAGFDCELLAAVPGRPNLVARLGSGSDGPVLGLLGHVDTVLATPSDWSVDPWSGELKDGCVWGRGALDMKSQVAAEVAAAVALAEEGWRPAQGELLVIATVDEETGGEQGVQHLCKQHPDKVRCDMLVNEGGGELLEFDGRRVYSVCVAEKGVFRFTISTRGRAGHASIPRIGDNALVKLAPILTRLAAAGLPRGPWGARERRPERGAGRGRGAGPAPGGADRADVRRDLHPDDGQGLRQDQRDPLARRGERGLPRAARAGRGARARPHRGGARGREVRAELRRARGGQPLADRHAADGPRPRVPRRGGPGLGRGAVRAARLHRLALVPRHLPRLRGLRLLPPVEDGHVRGEPPDPLRRRAHPGGGPRAGRPLLRGAGHEGAGVSPKEPKLRLGGMALRNGLLVHGPTHWAAAIRTRDGRIEVASGRKPDFGGRLLRGVPGARGVSKLAEAFAVVPIVKKNLPEAGLPMEDAKALGGMLLAAVISQSLRRGERTLGREAAVSVIGLAPALLVLRGGDI